MNDLQDQNEVEEIEDEFFKDASNDWDEDYTDGDLEAMWNAEMASQARELNEQNSWAR